MTPVAQRPRIEPTQAELRAAFERHRTATWPPTFEEAMQDPLLSRLLRLQAAHPPRAAQNLPGAAGRAVRSVRTPAPAAPHWQPAPGVVDRKRLAAGDRDDD